MKKISVMVGIFLGQTVFCSEGPVSSTMSAYFQRLHQAMCKEMTTGGYNTSTASKVTSPRQIPSAVGASLFFANCVDNYPPTIPKAQIFPRQNSADISPRALRKHFLSPSSNKKSTD